MTFIATRTALVAGVAACAVLAGACSPAAETPAPEAAEAAAPAQDVPMVGGAAMYPNKTIVENAVNSADHTTLVAAVTAAGLVETLSGPGPFTVFAPTDEAFAALPAGTVENLLKAENKDQLVAILKHHVVEGRVYADQAAKLESAKTIGGTTLPLAISKESAKAGNANIVATDIEASNGVIHVVDAVILP